MHFSFDFWNTIGHPSPFFATARNRFLAHMFGITETDAMRRYNETKKIVDGEAERFGRQLNEDEALDVLFSNFKTSELPDRDVIIFGINDLFDRFPPFVDPQLLIIFEHMINDGHTLSIASNTNYIHGEIITRVVLDRYPFVFSVFSDELGVPKPERAFFDEVFERAKLNNSNVMTRQDIMHIGDSHVCDYDGAIANGMQARLVKNATQTAYLLQELRKKYVA